MSGIISSYELSEDRLCREAILQGSCIEKPILTKSISSGGLFRATSHCGRDGYLDEYHQPQKDDRHGRQDILLIQLESGKKSLSSPN
jgi:hypothetical protein